ncbi:hypothetical protein OIU92_00160 [Escherichia coli]|nr:hypothetical protein [Escherichia coli]
MWLTARKCWMGLEMMRRQVASIGNIPGLLDMKQLGECLAPGRP